MNIDNENLEELIEKMTKDQILINLKLISKIKKSDKLFFQNEQLEIDKRYIQSIRRWFNADNRNKTINYITLIIENTFKIIDNICYNNTCSVNI